MKNQRPNDSHAEFIDVADLQVGHYIYLDVGWMGHPFALNSFRISSLDQIATIKGLGLERLRFSPAQSRLDQGIPNDIVKESSATGTVAASGAGIESASAQTKFAKPENAPVFADNPANAGDFDHSALPPEQVVVSEVVHRRERIAAQRASLQRCENQFNEAAHSYREIVESLNSRPDDCRRQGEAVVDDMIEQMGSPDEETLVRLLSEKAGERTSLHSINVSIVSLLLAKALVCTPEQMRDVGLGALLHDIGKMNISDRLRWVDNHFTASETAIYREHVGKGLILARKLGLSPGAQLVIAQHHEHFNGSGYPRSLKEEQIALPSRIVTLVNQYDNLCNPGNPALAVTPHEALSLLYAQSRPHFDGKVMAVFIRLMGVYPPGSVIELSTGRHALVVSVNSARPLRPNVLVHEPSVPASEAMIVDLESFPEIGIRRSIKPLQLPKAAYDYLSPRKRLCYFFERGGEAGATGLRYEH